MVFVFAAVVFYIMVLCQFPQLIPGTVAFSTYQASTDKKFSPDIVSPQHFTGAYLARHPVIYGNQVINLFSDIMPKLFIGTAKAVRVFLVHKTVIG